MVTFNFERLSLHEFRRHVRPEGFRGFPKAGTPYLRILL
jgi:hypothetical protein